MPNEVNGVNGIDPITGQQVQNVNGQENTGAVNAFEDEDVSMGTDTDSFVSSTSDKKTEPKNTQKADDGRDYVEVQSWGTGKDDCLSRIIQAHYGVNPYSKEGQAIMQAVIAANPQIYDSGRQAIVGGKVVAATDENKTETIIRDGEKMYLPTTTGDSTTVSASNSSNTSSSQTGATTFSDSPSSSSGSTSIFGIDEWVTNW